MPETPELNNDRFFDPDPSTRSIARELYFQVKDLPILSPHGHVDPRIFADNQPFPDPTGLMIIPDHYIFRMLYSQGISMESLGIPRKDGNPVETDARKIWQIFGDHFYLFAGTPTSVWLSDELYSVFGIREKLTGESAQNIYDHIRQKLQTPDFLPRSLFERFNIEVLTTTDPATSTLEYHQKIKDSGWKACIIPCFRPDAVINIDTEIWRKNIDSLSDVSGIEITSYKEYIRAIENRREYFRTMGAVSTDHAVVTPYTHRLSDNDADTIFQKALKGAADERDFSLFTAHMLMEMARMSIDDSLVMQIHPGSYRNHNRMIFDTFGPDMGCDIPVQTEYTSNLHELLTAYGNDNRLSLILFTLDESTYSRELAPLAGHYPALKLGPPWWFQDSINGMTRFRQYVTETAGIYNTVGFNDDTRAFPSIPARHDLSRRIDSNFLAGLVARHIVDMDDAERMCRDLTYRLVKKIYRL